MNASLGIDEYEKIEEKLIIHIKSELNRAYLTGQLKDFLNHLGYSSEGIKDWTASTKSKQKILVIGQTSVSRKDLNGTVKISTYNIHDFEFITSYEDIKKFDFSRLENTTKYQYILVGPMPHKLKGTDGESSMIERMETETDKFPSIHRLTVNDTLKISKTSFKNALEEISNH